MGATSLPNGLSVDAAHVGNVPAYVTGDGARFAAGTVLVAAGSADVTTGLTTVAFAVATVLGPLSSTAGTVGGVAFAAADPGVTAGNLDVRCYDQMGTASLASGTVTWLAIGT